MAQLFEFLLYQPIFNIFVGLYNLVGDVGLVVIIMTVVIKLLLWPLTAKAIEAQKSLSDLQPKMEELKKKYKDDQQTLAQETMKLYKEHKVNPLGSCLPILIQLPIFLALFWVLRNGLGGSDFHLLYEFIPNPGAINTVSFGIVDLARMSIPLAILAGLAQAWHAKTMSRRRPPKAAGEGGKDEDLMAMMNKQMLYFMPILTTFISLSLPGGVALYWFLSTLITAIQQYFMYKDKDDNDKNSDAIEGELV